MKTILPPDTSTFIDQLAGLFVVHWTCARACSLCNPTETEYPDTLSCASM